MTAATADHTALQAEILRALRYAPHKASELIEAVRAEGLDASPADLHAALRPLVRDQLVRAVALHTPVGDIMAWELAEPDAEPPAARSPAPKPAPKPAADAKPDTLSDWVCFPSTLEPLAADWSQRAFSLCPPNGKAERVWLSPRRVGILDALAADEPATLDAILARMDVQSSEHRAVQKQLSDMAQLRFVARELPAGAAKRAPESFPYRMLPRGRLLLDAYRKHIGIAAPAPLISDGADGLGHVVTTDWPDALERPDADHAARARMLAAEAQDTSDPGAPAPAPAAAPSRRPAAATATATDADPDAAAAAEAIVRDYQAAHPPVLMGMVERALRELSDSSREALREYAAALGDDVLEELLNCEFCARDALVAWCEREVA
jgi:hypothetical protein